MIIIGVVLLIIGFVASLLGVRVTGEHADRSAIVTASVNADATAVLAVRLSVDYPHSVAGVTEAAGAHLQSRLADLTGLTVTRVDISVTALHDPDSRTRRVR
ncbi:hypothetical protein ACFWU3_36070 [Streptomyces sp. NPDC058685]|uniref:hypothetical protein n=1 Tax=Streptomyces sp. NPDC058685 TaxID=3346598 RepID=UPI003650F206